MSPCGKAESGINLLQQAAMLLKVVGVQLDNVGHSILHHRKRRCRETGDSSRFNACSSTADFQATGGGTIGLDQSLDMKVNLNLSQALSKRLPPAPPSPVWQ